MVTDFYAMLEIDPGADRAAIEAALSRKQPQWSSGTRNPKTKHTFQSYLDQIPALRQALLGDPATRAAYDAEREAAQRAEREARLDRLQKRIRLRAAKGGLTVADRRVLRDEAVRLGLAATDFDRLAEAIPPRPDAPADDPGADVDLPLDMLDPVMRRQLRVALDHLRKADLYDALGVPRDAPVREITLRADAERQRWMRKTQVTAEKTAWLEVVTLAQSHLSTPAARARYDRTLTVEAEDQFKDAVQFAVQGLRQLDSGTLAALLDEGLALGLIPDRAERLVGRVCRAQGVAGGPVAASAAGTPGGLRLPRWLRCRSCSGLTDHAAVDRPTGPAACRHCGQSLRWSCPSCRLVHWVDEPRCSCGFRIENHEPFLRHFEAAQRLFRSRRYGTALAHLRRAQELAPGHVGTRKGILRVRERLAEIDRARAAVELAMGARQLVAARRAAEAWGRLLEPGLPAWHDAWTRIHQGLREALARVAKGRNRERTDPRAARAFYRQALEIAADLSEAIEGLKRCPPDPPSELSVEFVVDHVVLRWSAPPSDGFGPVSYVIRRKGLTAFQHPGEGVVIGTSETPEYRDPGVVPGTSVSYAVLTRRGEVDSIGAVAAGPVFLMAEAHDVRLESRGREVDLSWVPPRGTSEVRVVRKRGAAPTGPTDGDRIDALVDQAHDRDVDPDRVFFYGIYAVYRGPDGRATASRGVVVSTQPGVAVGAPEAPTLRHESDGRLTIAWAEPHRGFIKLLRTGAPLPHAPGTRLTPAEMAALQGDWIETKGPDHAVDTPPPAASSLVYTPLLSWGGSVTVGHPASFAVVADPTELRATRGGAGRVNLRWTWSVHGGETVVLYRAGTPPTGPDDPEAGRVAVGQADYDRQGQYTLTLPAEAAGPWHILVVARVQAADGREVISPGLEPTARTTVAGPHPEVTVSYTLRKPLRLTGRKASVTFRTEPPGLAVPPTVLVGHPRAVPLSFDDGETLAHFPAAQDGARFDLPAGVDLRRVRARVFPDPRTEPDELAPIRFRHPEADATRV